MKIAFICDWLMGMRGGERCLEAACEIYPKSDIFTLVHLEGTLSNGQPAAGKCYASYVFGKIEKK